MAVDTVEKLFQPVKVGDATLAHRVVMAPLTRFRADEEHVHHDIAIEYYAQRASVPGTLIISEGTFIALKAGGYGNVPGLWSKEQIAAWKKVTDAVHAKGSYIFCQIWALGRAADPNQLKKEGDFPHISASDIPMKDGDKAPRPLSEEEIQEYIETYATAAANAVEAGFDGIEVHGANGYLVDQFLQDVSNNRTDRWGGSIENRSRFALEVLAAIVARIGASKTAIRLSPWHRIQGMGMDDPVPTFSYLVKEIVKRFPDLAYLHFVEPRVQGFDTVERPANETNQPFFDLWKPRPFLSAGGYTLETALKTAETGQLVVFGRAFIANPDLPNRLRKNIPLQAWDRSTFYLTGPTASKGYTDYPFAESAAL